MRRLTFLITSGPTREYLDPVRYLSNASTGRMGKALAEAALRRGHRVVLVSGPAETRYPSDAEVVPVVSAREMMAQVKARLPESDVVIGAAAVADYRPAKVRRHKIKKDAGTMTLRLVKNPDVIRYVGRRKYGRTVVGFALESRDLVPAARRKLRDKGLDLIVANAPAAIGADTVSATLLDASGGMLGVEGVGKDCLAERIIDEAIRLSKDR